jgi:hypothetical protein
VNTNAFLPNSVLPGVLTLKLMLTRRMMATAALLLSGFIAACGPHPRNSSSETLTVYQDAPVLKPLDLDPLGNSPGDAYYFSAPLYSSPGGRMIGEVFGSKTLMKLSATNPEAEKRATLLFFTFAGGQDQIIALGAVDYPPAAAEFSPGKPVIRAVLGGTGRYMGARGELTSTRNTDGSYTQVFTLVR